MLKVNDNMLVMQKIEPLTSINQDFLESIKKSYKDFLTKGLQESLDEIATLLNAKFRKSEENISFSNVTTQRNGVLVSDEDTYRNRYLRVFVDVTVDGVLYPQMEIMRVPVQTKRGTLIIKGKEKVFVWKLRPKEGLSFELKGKESNLKLSTPRGSMTITQKVKDINFITTKKNKESASLVDYCRHLVHKEAERLNLKGYSLENHITNYELLTMILSKKESAGTTEGKVNKLLTWSSTASDFYDLGALRKELNKELTLQRALGHTLAKRVILSLEGKTIIYPAGEKVTQTMINNLNRALISRIDIRTIPDIQRKTLSREVKISRLPMGSRITKDIKKAFNVEGDERVAYKDYTGEYRLPAGTALTDENLRDLDILNVDSVYIEYRKETVKVPFSRTVLSNATVLGREIGLTPNEWYEYDIFAVNPLNTLKPCSTKLRQEDFLALLSYTLDARAGMITPPDIDFDFVKKVSGINETFKEIIVREFRKLLQQGAYAGKLSKGFEVPVDLKGLKDTFTALSINFENALTTTEGPLDELDDINPVATLSQINRIKADAKNATDKQRIVSMQYYGRIDPYETSAGKQVGLNNNLTGYVKLDELGVPMTPYLRVRVVGDSIRFNAEPDYLTAEEEAKFKIADLSSIKIREGNKVDPGQEVIARIPNFNGGDKTIIEMIPLRIIEYVNIAPEQHCGSTMQLIPFAESNDPSRDAFGLSLIKQSISCYKGEQPHTITPMYSDAFRGSDDFVMRAPEDARVKAIHRGRIDVILPDGTPDTWEVKEVSITPNTYTLLNIIVGEGQQLKAGDIIADSSIANGGMFSPGVNCFVAYIPKDGYNYEDANLISENLAAKLTSVSIEKADLYMPNKDCKLITYGQSMNYVSKGEDLIAYRTPLGETEHLPMTGLTAGFHFKTTKERDTSKLTAHMLAFNHLKRGDKLSGRHGDKGIESKTYKTSEMPQFANGIPVDICKSPCGIVSRMNIGQQLESSTGFISYLLGRKISTPTFNGGTREEVKELMQFCWDFSNLDVDVATTKWKTKGGAYNTLVSWARERINTFHEWKGCYTSDGKARLFMPETGTWSENEVSFGNVYLMKIMHEVNHKLHARSNIMNNTYVSLHEQPPKGSSRGGGQSTGEMESATILAHGAVNYHHEAINELSDNYYARTDLALEIIGRPPLYGTPNGKKWYPRSVENLMMYLYALGIELQENGRPLIDIDKMLSDDAMLYNENCFHISDSDLKELGSAVGYDITTETKEAVDDMLNLLFGGSDD